MGRVKALSDETQCVIRNAASQAKNLYSIPRENLRIRPTWAIKNGDDFSCQKYDRPFSKRAAQAIAKAKESIEQRRKSSARSSRKLPVKRQVRRSATPRALKNGRDLSG